jgi:hypothetical protein
MKKIIFLIGGAMLLIQMAAFAQFNTAEKTPIKLRKELGVSMNPSGEGTLFFRKEFKENTFWRVDARVKGYQFGSASFADVGIGFGIEKHVKINDKFSFYHGLNFGLGYSQTLSNTMRITNNNIVVFDDSYNINRSYSAYMGYRLGIRYEVNKRVFIGAEINPKIGISTVGKIPLPSIGGGSASVTMGLKF